MTEKELRSKVVATAKKYLGYNEADGSHKKIIDLYNSHKPLARGYKVRYTDAWCATYASAIGIECGLTDIMPTECSCSRLITLYTNLGRWQENDAYKPEEGDLIIYDWEDSGKGDNKGAPNHVGIVVAVSGNVIKVIEGNKNEAVEYRSLALNGKYIRGFCLPNYASKATAEKYTKAQIDAAKKEVQTKANLSDATIKYLMDYKYGEDLIIKLANAM